MSYKVIRLQGYKVTRLQGYNYSLSDLGDCAFHIEIAFGDVVVFAVENFLEAFDGFGDRDLFAFAAGEDLGDTEGLAQEALDLAGTEDGEFVVGRKLVHAKDGDDVLEIFVTLQDALDASCDVVMFLADDFRRERARGGRQRIDRGIDAELGDGTFEHDGGIE